LRQRQNLQINFFRLPPAENAQVAKEQSGLGGGENDGKHTNNRTENKTKSNKKGNKELAKKAKEGEKKKNCATLSQQRGKRKASTAVSKKGKLEESERENENSITATVVAFFSACVCVCVCGMCPQGFSAAQVMRNANRHTGGATERTSISFMFRKILQYLLKPKIMKPERK